MIKDLFNFSYSKVRRIKKVFIAFAVMFSLSMSANAQTNNVTGKVIDTSGEPLIGVTVKVKGTNKVAVTDLDGMFSIKANNGDILECSYIGYLSKEQKVVAGTQSILLKADTKELNEVVVTALGIKREQKALSYNVQQVKGDDMLKNKDANFINSLNGKVAGVNINTSSSGIGGASKVVMRGTRSIEQSSNVLYVVDGIPMFN